MKTLLPPLSSSKVRKAAAVARATPGGATLDAVSIASLQAEDAKNEAIGATAGTKTNKKKKGGRVGLLDLKPELGAQSGGRSTGANLPLPPVRTPRSAEEAMGAAIDLYWRVVETITNDSEFPEMRREWEDGILDRLGVSEGVSRIWDIQHGGPGAFADGDDGAVSAGEVAAGLPVQQHQA